MKVNHIALTSRSEQNADRYFKDLLGLEKVRVKTIPAGLAGKVLKFDQEITAIDYEGPGVRFEVFLLEISKASGPEIRHTGLEVEDREDLISRAKELGLEIRVGEKDGRKIIFISDFDGNLFEIKEK